MSDRPDFDAIKAELDASRDQLIEAWEACASYVKVLAARGGTDAVHFAERLEVAERRNRAAALMARYALPSEPQRSESAPHTGPDGQRGGVPEDETPKGKSSRS